MDNVLAPDKPTITQLRLSSWDTINVDIAVDYHLHTNYTDGTASVEKIAQAAIEKGIVEILFSEHVRHSSNFFSAYAREVKSLQYTKLKAFVGIETKILNHDGYLDCSPRIASGCDAIIGSVHRPPNEEKKLQSWLQFDLKQALKKEIQLSLAIVEKSQAHILGHPMGMVISNFNICPYDHLYELACACHNYDKAFELNFRYCQSPQKLVEIVKRANCKVSFGSDAHSLLEVGKSWQVFMNIRMEEK